MFHLKILNLEEPQRANSVRETSSVQATQQDANGALLATKLMKNIQDASSALKIQLLLLKEAIVWHAKRLHMLTRLELRASHMTSYKQPVTKDFIFIKC